MMKTTPTCSRALRTQSEWAMVRQHLKHFAPNILWGGNQALSFLSLQIIYQFYFYPIYSCHLSHFYFFQRLTCCSQICRRHFHPWADFVWAKILGFCQNINIQATKAILAMVSFTRYEESYTKTMAMWTIVKWYSYSYRKRTLWNRKYGCLAVRGKLNTFKLCSSFFFLQTLFFPTSNN